MSAQLRVILDFTWEISMASFIFRPFVVRTNVLNVVPVPSGIVANKYKGTGSISGLVREQGNPVRRRVNLHARPTGIVVASVWSGIDGKYSFTKINKSYKYYAVSIDESGGIKQYPAQVQDLLQGNYDEIAQP